MPAFAAGEIDVLVATTVIEVGVDVPNATVMVVMDAERFGVSQLHQLRGRIGRGSAPGPVPARHRDAGRARRRASGSTRSRPPRDGFELARLDVEQRREGDILGASQSGRRSQLKLLSLLRDEDVIEQARDEATELIADDPELAGYPGLAALVAGLVARRAGRLPGEGVTVTAHRRRVGRRAHAARAPAAAPARRPTGCARRCSAHSTGCSNSTAPGCSTCSPAPGRSASRRLARRGRGRRWSTPAATRYRSCAATPSALGLRRRRGPQPAGRGVPAPATRPSAFDLVFADPPYAYADDAARVRPARLWSSPSGWLADGAVVVVERSAAIRRAGLAECDPTGQAQALR